MLTQADYRACLLANYRAAKASNRKRVTPLTPKQAYSLAKAATKPLPLDREARLIEQAKRELKDYMHNNSTPRARWLGAYQWARFYAATQSLS